MSFRIVLFRNFIRCVPHTALPLSLLLGSILPGCSGGGLKRNVNGDGLDASGNVLDASIDGSVDIGDRDTDAEVSNQQLVITPASSTHTIGAGGLPTLSFTAALTPARGAMPTVHWSADHPELGSIDQDGLFTPAGAAGTVTITATAGPIRATTTVKLVIDAKQEGDPTPVEGGAGGAGGVGGEGGGTAITDPALRAALDLSPTVDNDLAWLYPYDGTVWPRGLPAPLLQWRHGAHEALAVKLRIEVGTDFVYQGYFGPPSALPAGQAIVRLPIPQQVWRNALYSGSEMRVSLVIAAADGMGGYAAFSPVAPLTWKIAPGSLKGTVYYNTYGSDLAKQVDGLAGRFGGATLAIRGTSKNPELVAGATTDDESGCRVCHTVSGDGSTLIVQHDDNLISSRYALTNHNQESTYPPADNGKFGWAALSPDGTVALGNSGPPSQWPNIASLGASGLYRVEDGAVLDSPGLADFVTRAATPVFSTAGNRVAFNFWAGPGTLTDVSGNGRSLVMMDVAKVDETTYLFSNPTKLFTATQGDDLPGWPFFLPDDSGVIFEIEKERSTAIEGEVFVTRGGARGELWWTDLAGNATRLDRLNGLGYLPTGPDGHHDDATLQYEPTVAPIVAGGYAWVVFTSRRLYGNVATRAPYESDPREHDITANPGNTKGPTTKKLWVAAIDMPPIPGTDPSHPAFYLPAQELFAGNSRAFWVPDACHELGERCESGDECCGGYCRANAEGVPVCMDELPPATCAMEYEHCSTDTDCCVDESTQLTCINNRCAQSTILL